MIQKQIKTIGLTILIAASTAALTFAQMDMPDMPSGQDGGFGGDGMGGFGMQMVEPGTYSNDEAGYSIRIPNGFTGMSLPSPANSLWVVQGRNLQSAQDADDVLQFMVLYSPEGATAGEAPDFGTTDTEQLEQDLREMQSGQGPSGQFEVSEVSQVTVSGETAARIRFSLEPEGSDEALHGVMYSFEHGGSRLVVQYLGGRGQESRVRSLAEENIRTLSLE